MPKFAQVDAEGRLWQVTDLLPQAQSESVAIGNLNEHYTSKIN